MVLLGVIEGNRVLQVRAGPGGLAQIKPTVPESTMGR